MNRFSRLFGGVLLVSGTAIGAGMLALPVITAFGGFLPSLGLIFFSWAFLFATSWLLLDVTLSFKGDVNLISMAGRTLGVPGRLLCWISYLLLLYSLTAAYISASAPLFLRFIQFTIGIAPPSWLGPFPLLILFGFFVYLGTSSVDRVNRLLMFCLVVAYLLLIAFLPSHIEPLFLKHVDFKATWIALPVVITSFGFHIIIPTLSAYLNHNKHELRQTLFWGSLIPLIVYAIWEMLVLGTVPLQGSHSLISAWKNGETGTDPLSQILNISWVGDIANAFSFFAIVTSFLGVSLSLSDFLTDGLKMKRFSFGKEFASLLTFIPPLLFIYTCPKAFLLALEYAGIFVVVLLCLLPALMAWNLPNYKSILRRLFLLGILIISLGIIVLVVMERFGFFNSLIFSYTEMG